MPCAELSVLTGLVVVALTGRGCTHGFRINSLCLDTHLFLGLQPLVVFLLLAAALPPLPPSSQSALPSRKGC